MAGSPAVIRVLIVDDDPDFADALKHALLDAGGFTVRTAMEAFWRLDERAAARGLGRTLALDPAHTVAPVEAARLDRLTESRYALVGAPLARGALLALGVASALIAAACGIALVRRLLAPPPEPLEGAR